MSQTADLSKYPLPEALTRRVVAYLNVFRLFISVALTAAYFFDLLTKTPFMTSGATAGTMLIAYGVLAVYLVIEARRPTTQHFFLAQISLFIDILFVSIFLFIFGGLETGLGTLLIFASASAAFLLPLRMALFLASLAVLAFVSEALVGVWLHARSNSTLIQAGLYGITTFITTTLANLLAFWVKDYRLVAEQQAVELVRLEQINELIIRRMRSGVLAVDDQRHIQMMNESAWFLIGNPSTQRKLLVDVSPELDAALTQWRNNPALDTEPVVLQASQAEVAPKFVSLPGTSNIRVLIFLEDNDVIAQRARELSARSLAKLSGSIAHEIRNPLSAINHAAQLLAESENVHTDDKRLVEIIDNQARRMNGIVENILQLSRQEKSRPEIFDLTAWLTAIVEEFKAALPAMDINLGTDIEGGEEDEDKEDEDREDEDREDEDMLVVFDRSQLHQTIWKLMDNAMQHAGRDNSAPQVRIIIAPQPDSGSCMVTVEDNGPGIPAAQIEHIFEPFYTTHKQGSGLGLYIARQLCEVNQAELTVDSSPGSGTHFHVRIQLARSGKHRLPTEL